MVSMGHKDDVERFLARARSGGAAAAAVAATADVVPLPTSESAPWGLTALRGRLVELSARGASAVLTMAIELVSEAQVAGEPVAWVTLTGGSFYPPDAADSGVDLAALVVVRVASAILATRAAERLLRSGAFGLVVLDLVELGVSVELNKALAMATQGRLVTLAQAHDAAIVCLTDKPDDTASVGSLVSLRVAALRTRTPSGQLGVALRAIKDKRRGPGWTHAGARKGPAGYG